MVFDILLYLHNPVGRFLSRALLSQGKGLVQVISGIVLPTRMVVSRSQVRLLLQYVRARLTRQVA